MRFARLQLRYQIARPDLDLLSMTLEDRYAYPEYQCESTQDGWVSIKHVESGKVRFVPREAVKSADPVVEQAQQKQQGGKR